MENLPRTLLLVDDEVIIAIAQAQLLEKEGYKVLQAYNGQEAIDIVRNGNHPIDLILMDIDLGAGMDGTDTALDILKDHDLPVVFLSSHTERDIVEKTEKITSYGYIVKDSGITVLTASIKMAFKLHEAHRELTKKEKSLREIEEKTRNIINNLPLGIHQYRLEADGRLIFEGANAAADRLLNVNNSGFIGMSIGEAFPNLIATEVPNRYRQVCAEGTPWHSNRIEYEDMRIKGAYEIHAFQTEPGHMAVLFNDITERQYAEERMRILSTLVDIAPASITVHDFDGNFIYANQKTFELHGYTEDEFFHVNLRDLDTPESSRLIEPRMKQLLEKGEMSFEAGHFRKDGSILPLNIHVKTSAWSGARVLLSVAMDVTERKKAEDALQESEGKYRRFFDQSPIGAAISTPDGNFISVNAEMCRMIGYSEEEFVSLRFMDITHPDHLNADIEQVRRIQSGEIDHYSTDKQYLRKDGTSIWGHLSLRAIRDAGGRLLCFLPMIVDITERKRAEEALLESESRFRTLVNSMEDYVFTLDREQRITGLYGKWLAKEGLSAEMFLGKTAREIFGVEKSSVHESAVQRAFKGEYVIYDWSFEDQGDTMYLQTSLSPVFDPEDTIIAFVGIGRNITGVIHAEKVLRESEARYLRITETLTDYIYTVYVENGKVVETRHGPGCLAVTGYTEEEFNNDPYLWYRIIDARDRAAVEDHARGILADIVTPAVEHRIVKKDGAERWVRNTPVSRHDELGRLVSYDGLIQDITDRKTIEEELMEREEIFKIFMKNSPVYVFFKDEKIRAARLSDNYEKLLGRPMHELIGKTMYDLFPNEFARSMVEDDIKVLRDGRQVDVIEEFNGRVYSTTKFPIPRLDKPPFLAGFTVDITEQRAAEKALRDSEEKYRRLFENASMGVFHSLPNGRFLEVNPSLARMMGYESPEEMVRIVTNISTQIYTDPKDRADLLVATMNAEGWIYTQNNYRRKDGSLMIGNVALRKELHPDGSVAYLEGFIEDITERKRAEEALAKSVQEKELLLKELQHRVKNNLNVISSLLGLELDKLKDDRTRQIFINAQYRIRSMSAIYEQLYNSAALDRVDLERYIKDLAESLYETYAIDSGRVRLTTSIEKIQIDLKRAIPLGLILNELIMNALKHAFPVNKKGVIRVELVTSKEAVALSVSDNGVGFPEGVNPVTADTMGLHLVRMLTRQIGGELSFVKKKGVKTLVKFSLQ